MTATTTTLTEDAVLDLVIEDLLPSAEDSDAGTCICWTDITTAA